MLVFVVASLCLFPFVILQEAFVCPRCQKPFFGKGDGSSRTKRCAHCGIEVGTPADAPTADPKL
jgi:hypothetical protein